MGVVRRLSVALLVSASLLACGCSAAVSPNANVQLPPAEAVADYQLGGAYAPDPAVGIVVRDSTEQPADGVYSVCYVNGFQSQPGAAWPAELLLTDATGEPLIDPDWPDEHILDISTAGKRADAAARIGETVELCESKGFLAVEFDNLDSYTRSGGQLALRDTIAFATLLVDIAHANGLAAGQKNTVELGSRGRDEVGFDFAVAEECDQYRECEAYTDVYGDAVIAIEYTDELRRPFEQVCNAPSTPETTVLRDRDLASAGDPDHHFEFCPLP